MRVVFVKATDMKIYKAVVGTIVKLRGQVLEEQLMKGNVQEYSGAWPPKNKVKINLKDLK